MKRGVILVAAFLSYILLSTAQVYAAGDLTGSWNLNEGTGSIVSDSSGNGNNGTMIGGCTWVDGKYGKGLHFDGSGYVEIPHNESLNSANFTIEAWIFLDSDVTEQWRIVSKQQDLGHSYSLSIFGSGYWGGVDGNQLVLSIGNGVDWVNFISATHLSNKTWYHVAGTHEGTTSRIYIDGVLDKNGTTGQQTAANTGVLNIGCFGSGSQFFFNGTIDEVKIYNRALSESELQVDMIPEFTSLLIVLPSFMVVTLLAVIFNRKKAKLPKGAKN